MGIPIIGDVIKGVKDIVSEVVVDKDKKNEILARIDEQYHEQMMGQLAVNKQEAAHSSVFVAGWRPYIGWGCGTALIYNTLIAPAFGLAVADLAFLQTVLLGMLGIGAMRSFEKVKGVADNNGAPSLPTGVKKIFKRKSKEPENLLPISYELPEDAPWMK